MSELLNSGWIHQTAKQRAERIVKAWRESGLLDGLNGMSGARFNNLALLLESEASVLLREPTLIGQLDAYIEGKNYKQAKNILLEIIEGLSNDIIKKHCE